MRKLERTLWEMKMEPLWPDDTRGGSNFRSDLGREIRHNLERELASDFRRGWDGDWGREFDGSLTSQLRTDPLSATGGGSSSASTSAPVFAYSQKNFHIDGNLYSIFSPFQARKSTSRPSFLRGQTEQSSPTPPASGSASPRSSSTRNRRWKLKFHNQDIPAQYRTTSSATAGSSSAAAGTSTGESTDSAGPSTAESSHSRMSSSSFFSSSRTSYSSSSFKETRRESSSSTSSFRHSFDDEDMGLSSLRRGIKREDPFEVLDLSQPRLGLFSDWSRTSGAGGSGSSGGGSARHDDKDAEFGSLHRRLRKSHFRSSVFDDSDEEQQSSAFRAGINEPLNLCLADHAKRRQERQQRKEENAEERVRILVKDEPVDVDTEEHRPPRNVSPFTAAKERFEQRRRRLFGERRSLTDSTLAKMLSRTPSPPPTKKESSRRRAEDVEVQTNPPREEDVLDLSLRSKHDKTKRKVHFEKQGIREDTWSRSTASSSSATQASPSPKEEETSSSPLWRGRRVPYISQMLENMTIWDEDTNSPRPIDVPPCIETEDDSMESVQQMPTSNRERLQHPAYSHQQYHAFTPAYLPESVLQGFGSKFAKTENGSFLTDHMAREYEMMRKAFEAKAAAFFETSPSTPGTSLEVPPPTMKSSTAPNLAVTEPQPSPTVQRSESEPTVGGSYCVFLPGTFVHPGPVYITPQQQQPPAQSLVQDNVPSKVVTTIHVTAPSPPPPKEQGTNVTTVELKPKMVDTKLNLLTLPNLSPSVAPKPFPRQKRHAVDIDTSSATTSKSPFANDISICKFKLIKGVQPMLEEKKSFYVPLPRSSARSEPPKESNSSIVSTASAQSAPPKQERFRTYKIHVGSQEELGRKLAAGKKLRRRSRKALVREKLEATFREQGFLIKTQQVSSAEGSVYCKFRQLKKFTRYLFKSWRNYLPKDLEEISGPAQAAELFGSGSLPPPGLLSFAESPAGEASTNAQLCSPGTSRTSSVSGSAFATEPYISVCSPGASRSPSLSGTSGIGTSIFTGDSASVASPASDGASSAALLDTISLSGSSLLSPASSASSASSISPVSMTGSDAR